jgi:ribosomal protein S18 acetylase RimI-like enzyme
MSVHRGGAAEDPREGPCSSTPTHTNVSLRAITPDDEPFVRDVYASTRDAELAMVDWDDDTKQRFVDQQFHAQSVHYAANHAGADFDLIVVDGEPIGRLYVHRGDEELHLLDIAVLAAHRNRGIGTMLVRDLTEEAAVAGLPLRLHVEMFNGGARRLYDRFGFRPVEQRGVYILMEWNAT